MSGRHKELGPYIKTVINKKQKVFQATVFKRATQTQLNYLIAYMEGILPPILSLSKFIIRKKQEEITNVHSWDEFNTFLEHELRASGIVKFKFSW